jgi:hypothetical protein
MRQARRGGSARHEGERAKKQVRKSSERDPRRRGRLSRLIDRSIERKKQWMNMLSSVRKRGGREIRTLHFCPRIASSLPASPSSSCTTASGKATSPTLALFCRLGADPSPFPPFATAPAGLASELPAELGPRLKRALWENPEGVGRDDGAAAATFALVTESGSSGYWDESVSVRVEEVRVEVDDAEEGSREWEVEAEGWEG